ncbi:MAG TPA: cysteine desulfurase-like protein [Thermoleophilaceae bacterium]|nr:cysteine desulfurase-like protein [Thermoleophilaceae bacterium]
MNRERFPGLQDGWARLDGPAGTQMVDTAIDAVADWSRSGRNANHGGLFDAARATDELVDSTRRVLAELLGADPHGVVIGPNMTSLTLKFAGAVGRELQPGDEIVCTRLDHDANVGPWLLAAERSGATVRFAEPDRETLELPVSAVETVLTERTRWVAVTAASNAVGTIPDVAAIVAAAHDAGARTYVDAVHATPHRRLDVAALKTDVLVCSSYKWFGPHAGILCAAPELLEQLTPDKIRPAPDHGPDKWESGTASFETIAGIRAAAEYMLELDWNAVEAHEKAMLGVMLAGLSSIDGVHVHGAPAERAPTVMFSVDGRTADDVARRLATAKVAVWDGTYYAWELGRFLGLGEDGAIRAGAVHYNEPADIERLLAAVEAAVS